MTDLPDVKLRALTNFPVAVTGRTGIKVVKVGNKYYLDLDVSRLADASNIPAEQVDQYEFTIHNKILDSYVNIPFAIGATAGVAAIDGHTGLLDIGNGLGFTGDVLENLLVGFTVNTVATIAGLKALNTTLYKTARLTAVGRAGVFVWTLGDYSAHVAADTNNGVYIKADAVPASGAGGGAWVRQFDFVNYQSRWFGTVADHSTDNSAIINTIIIVSDLTNTLTGAGQQGEAYIHIEGGVRFASKSLSFLPSGNHIFVTLFYFANSNTTKGVPSGGGGTNELVKLIVNSGYPGDGTGGFVGEDRVHAILHPSHILNADKQNAGADAHLGTGQVRIGTDVGYVRTSYEHQDENVLRYREIYQSTGTNDESNGIWHQPFNMNIGLNNVGSTGWPTIPANGTVITGVTSGAKGVKTFHNATDCFVNFRSGQFIPLEKITDGVTTSTSTIASPNGVTYTETSYPSLAFGFDNPVMAYGVPPGFCITGADFGARVTFRKSTGSVGAGQHKETVTNAGFMLTNTAAAVPVDADSIQLVLDNHKRAVFVDGTVNGDGSTGKSFAQGVAAWGNLTSASVGVSSNSGNVGSVTRPGGSPVGVFQVLFINLLTNANFSPALSRSNFADNLTVTGISTAGFNINCFNSSGVLTDPLGTIYFTVNGGIGI